jgi:hypothetical protein
MTKPQKSLLSISVEFVIMTPDQLKEIRFGLSKKTEAGVDQWEIVFKLSKRDKKTDPLVQLVEAKVKADLKDNALAEETAIKGPNKAQSDHLTLNTATAGERFAAGKIQKASLDRSVKATIPARTA